MFCQAATVLGAPAGLSSVSLGFDFASGDYGTDQTTDSYRIPLTLGFTPTEQLDIALVIPYLYQNNRSTVPLGGMRFSTHNSGTDTETGMGGMGGGSTAVSTNDSQSGLGDITLTAGYILIPEAEKTPMLRPLVYAKLPTADEDKGLGTGAYDFGGGLSLAKGFGDWFAYAEALYIAPGSTSSFNPNNYWTYLASTSYRVTERLVYGIDLSGATSAFDASAEALEVQLEVNYWTSQRASVGGYVAKGLSDGSPDYGVGFYGAIWF